MKEKTLVNIIKYSPSVFILILTIIISILAYKEHRANIEVEKNLIEQIQIEEEKEETKAWIDSIYQSLIDAKHDSESSLKSNLRNQVHNAYHIAYRIFNKYKNEKSKEEIVDIIKASLRSIRNNDGRGYFFIYERTGKNILNSDFPEIEGKSLWNYKDMRGVPLLQEMYKILNNKSETFYEWYWHKSKDKTKEYKKLGFFKKFEPYDWFIGTGEYVKDFEDTLKKTALDYISKVRYKDDRYIYVTDEKGVVLSHKYTNILGKNIIDYVDKFSTYYKNKENFSNGRFIEYKFLRDKANKKIAYVRWIKEWNLAIGTGFNFDKINKKILQRQKHLEEKYNQYLKEATLLSSILIFILLVISHIISRFIEKNFYNYKSNLEDKHKTLIKAQKTARIGDWKLNIETMELYWSDAILDIIGIKKAPNKLEFEFLKSFVHPDDCSSFERLIKDAIENKKDFMSIHRIIKPHNKKIMWVDCRGQIGKSGLSFYGTIQDITKLKLLEEEKNQKETLLFQQSKMAAMGEMLGNIAHQWRQPLSIITTISTGAKVQSELGVLDKKSLNKTLDKVTNTAQHLSQTIEDFRTFFNPKDDHFTKFTTKSVFSKTLNLINAQFKSNNITVIKNIDDLEIESLENELIQALINILNNSRDALISSNHLKEKLIFIDAYKENEYFVIEIKDNGGGIDNNIIDRIFEPYFTTKHQSHGTGIGLYMTQQIINKLLGGSIIVRNHCFFNGDNKYEGANFIISIPLDRKN